MENVKHLTEMDEIKAFSDPYRMIIMKNYYKLGEPATVKQIADNMSEVPAKVHYHVKKLESAGILALKHTKEINGIVAKFYEPTAKSFKIENNEIGDFTFNSKMNPEHNLASDTYDNSKTKYIEHIVEANNEALKHIAVNEVELTEDEYREIVDFIQSKTNRQERNPGSNAKKFHMFTSIFECQQ